MKRPKSYLEELAEKLGPSTAIGRKQARKAAKRGSGSGGAKVATVTATPSDAAGSAKAKPPTVSRTALAAIRRGGRQDVVAPSTPFRIDVNKLHPPGVVPDLAMDLAMDDINAASEWAGAAFQRNAYASAFWEGQEFLGYPYLSVLSQRPEYRAIVETNATESMRKGYKIVSTDKDTNKDEQIRALTDFMNDLRVKDVLKKASSDDGYFGRSHVFVDTGTEDPGELKQPIGDGRDGVTKLKISRKTKLSFRTVEALWCYPNAYNSNNPLAKDWYNPQSWFANGREVHKTRLLPFVAHPVADLLKPAYSFGGLSMSQMAKPYVDNWLRIRQSVADLVQAFSTMVLSTDMQSSLAGDGANIVLRAIAFNATRANNGLMMVDKNSEEMSNIAVPLGTLDALQAQAQEHMAAVARIPIVKLLGIQPAGLNADSEGIMRAFYDSIGAYQESFYRPHLTTMFEFCQIVLWGAVDPGLSFVFEPLYTLDEKGRAEVDKIRAETDVILVDSGILHQEEARARIAGDPDAPYQGLNVDDVPEPPAEPGEEEGGDKPEEGGGTLEPTKIKSSINVAGNDDYPQAAE